jgi:hypothetical protein
MLKNLYALLYFTGLKLTSMPLGFVNLVLWAIQLYISIFPSIRGRRKETPNRRLSRGARRRIAPMNGSLFQRNLFLMSSGEGLPNKDDPSTRSKLADPNGSR